MIQTNNDFSSSSSSSSWSWHQDKLFERALVMFQDDDESPDRWEKIAAQVPGKSAMEVKKHYDDLEYDVMEIELGRVELPSYKGELESESWVNDSAGSEVWFRSKEKEKERESERRKGVPWTEEEHRLFLIGLQKYGKGDWRSISRNAVVSRTPTQVASHAQKYFLRLNSVNKKDRKRSSIHDITMADSISLDQSNNQNRVGITTADHSSIELTDESKFFNEQGKSFGNNHGFESPLL